MLDLSVLTEKYFEIKMPNGEVLEIKKPTQKMALEFSNNKEFIKAQNSNDMETVLKIAMNRVETILNHNKEGKKISKDELAGLSFDMINLIVESYIKWVQEVNSNPN